MWPLVIMPLAWTSMGDFELQGTTIKNPNNVEVGKLVFGQGVKYDNEVHNQIEYSKKRCG